MWFTLRKSTPAAAMSGRWSGSGLISELNALNASTVSSLSEVSLSIELKPSFPGESNGTADNAH